MQALGNIVLPITTWGLITSFRMFLWYMRKKEAGEIINSMSDEEVYIIKWLVLEM